MTEKHEIICIECPMGCHIELTVDEKGEVLSVIGNQCKTGKTYAASEFRSPMRTLTTTVFVEGAEARLLAVRSSRPVPKALLKECMRTLSSTRVSPPVSLGQVIVPDILATGANIVSSGSL
jgi:CxxC motif-containing protein